MMFRISMVDFEGHVRLQPLVENAKTKYHERSDKVDCEDTVILSGVGWGREGGRGEREGGKGGRKIEEWH